MLLHYPAFLALQLYNPSVPMCSFTLITTVHLRREGTELPIHRLTDWLGASNRGNNARQIGGKENFWGGRAPGRNSFLLPFICDFWNFPSGVQSGSTNLVKGCVNLSESFRPHYSSPSNGRINFKTWSASVPFRVDQNGLWTYPTIPPRTQPKICRCTHPLAKTKFRS